MMQRPTCTGIRVRSPADAHVIFHGVALNLLPIVSRRLDTEERRAISSGCVFVWEERGPNAEATGLGIERWTDSIRWGPSRVRDEFLFYHEKERPLADIETTSDSDTTSPSSHFSPDQSHLRDNLIKQTYSVFVDTPKGRRKWHLIAYFTQNSLHHLRTIDDCHDLSSIRVPPGTYKSARSAKGGKSSRDHHHSDSLLTLDHGYLHHPSLHTHNFLEGHNYATFTVDNVADLRHHSGAPRFLGPHQPGSYILGPRGSSETLAPLTYLQAIPPPRRHPIDEKALMSFTSPFV